MQTLRASVLVRATGALFALTIAAPVLEAQVAARVASASPVNALPAASPITWTTATPFPAAIDHHVTFVTSGSRGDWLHVIGGGDGRAGGNAWRARIARDGGLGTWEKDESVPTARSGMAFGSDGRYSVLAGGATANEPAQDVYIANVWGDGRMGAWTPTQFPLPARRSHASTVVANGHVFVIGGSDGIAATSTVYRAKITRTGEVSAWTPLAELPGPRSHHAAFAYEGALYVVGGFDAPVAATPLGDVLRATVAKDGSLGPWQRVSTLDAALATHAVAVKDGYLYVIGGAEGEGKTSDRVMRAALARDGALGAWETTSSTLPAPRAHVHQVPVLRDHLFSIGGSRSGRAVDEVVVGKFVNYGTALRSA